MAEAPPQPVAMIIAGPNGSGKSTAAAGLLPEGHIFVNADLIAEELTGVPAFADINAGRRLIAKVDELEKRRIGFAFETTLATRMLRERVLRWKKLGYRVRLIFFWLPSDDLAVSRVIARHLGGGHFVPEETVRRRFRGGLKNFVKLYAPIVDSWRIYDNSGIEGPVLIARGTKEGITVEDEALWAQVQETMRT